MDARLVFLLGGIGYIGLELLWRARSHWCMGLAGGLCALLLYALYTRVPMPVGAAFLWGMLIICAVEFLFGFLFNIKLHMEVWDYSRFRYHLYGQVCLPYALFWGLLGMFFWAIL